MKLKLSFGLPGYELKTMHYETFTAVLLFLSTHIDGSAIFQNHLCFHYRKHQFYKEIAQPLSSRIYTNEYTNKSI